MPVPQGQVSLAHEGQGQEGTLVQHRQRVDGEGGERKFLHSTLGEWGHPRDVPSAGSCSREKREPEDKAAVMVDRAEEEEEGVGVSASMGFMSLHCPASP